MLVAVDRDPCLVLIDSLAPSLMLEDCGAVLFFAAGTLAGPG